MCGSGLWVALENTLILRDGFVRFAGLLERDGALDFGFFGGGLAVAYESS
jgi:hypothetical protein